MNELIFQSQLHLPLMSNQKRLWIMSQQNASNPAYNLQLTYHIEGAIIYENFTESIRLLFERQHTMFSIFKHKDGVPYIDIIPRPVNVELIDFSHLPAGTRKEEIFSFAGNESRKCFDIEKGPLYRLYFLKEDNENFYFHAIIHHIIFDGWSIRVIVQELSRIYTNLCRGINKKPKPLIYQSYDFAELEEKSGLGKDEIALVEFWKENLKDCPLELKFPYDYPRKKTMTGLGYREPVFISEATTIKLKGICKSENSSLFKTMLSVLGVLMQKYTGENDICIGFPVSNRRKHPSLEEIFGFFVSTCLVRIKIDGEFNFRQLLNYTKDVANKAIENSELPFDKIIEAVNPERRLNLNPLFQISLSWWNNVTVPMDLDGNICERVNVPEGVSPFDISFYLWEKGDHIEGEIEYSTDLLKHETILRLKNNFLNLINNLVEYSDTRIESLSMITNEERLIIDGFNDTSTNYPKEKTIVDLFEEMVNLYHGKTAVAFKEDSLTYSELNEKSNQLARVMRNSGVRANDPVGILVDRSVDMVVGILGILKAGGAYVPLDPEYPEFRKNFIIRDSGCKILVTQNKYITETAEGIAKFSLDSSNSYHNDKSNIEGINVSTDLAYIIYTSGTTGVPKGTLIPQQGVVRLVRNTNYVDFTSDDRVLQSTSIVFDASTVGIFGSLLNGATLYLVDKETVLDPNLLGDALAKDNITMTDFPTAVFTQIAELRADIFIKLKTLLIGGDALSASQVNKVRKINPQLTVINEYGPTENSCNSTAYKVDRDFDYNIPIGKPISNSTAYIFDRNMNYQPIGIIGELYVGGDGLSRGYLNREDLNRTCFIDHPNFPGSRLYKTGDLARWLPDGNIEFHGRIDNQLKIRGLRVELGEIESVISEIDGIIETVINPIKTEEGDYKLAAFLNVAETFKMDLKEIISRVKEKLPSYMVPSAYKLMHGFPLTINGKIDRKALPDPEFPAAEVRNGPLNSIEELLVRTWKEILHIDSVGLNTNFFEAGGSSILIPRIIVNLQQNYNITIKSVNIFEYPTVKSLADFISSSNGQKAEDHNVDNSGKKTVYDKNGSRDVAVIGMAGYFPGAENVNQFWEIIKKGEVVISFFSKEELKNKGVPDELLDNPGYVYANGVVGRAEMFEPAFFEITPREADFMDPQHRLFLEVCYEALEDSGYAPRTRSRNIGVFAGEGMNNYLLKSLIRHPKALRSIGEFQTIVNNGNDFLTTRVSYKLNLTGPSLDIQTACSTSLVAIHMACQSLLNHDCEMALGGGVSIQFPRGHGYMYKKGGILSPTGHCRPFDDDADGTIVGEGAAVILLKRLDDAVRDRDHIYAVIKSTAINNDGAVKVGYMAPSLEGQVRVMKQAQEMAGISSETITFLETHGTGTKLGDPIEIAALKKAFSQSGEQEAYCALGAVKANIGHLDAASGVAGVIKTILALKQKQIPPLAGFQSLNHELELKNSPFYINTKLKDWETDNIPRRGAVSSFGIGGTNAHCIIEEWIQPEIKKDEETRYHLLPVSARTQDSLSKMNEKYLSFFETTDLDISDIAYTMQHGREFFKFRQLFATDDLKEKSHFITNKGIQLFEKPRTVFMFTGQGSQYLSMSKGLYDNFLTFKKYIDSANEILKKDCEIDLIELLFASESTLNINETIYAQPALVAVQYATVKLLEEFGIKPDMLIGHSIGELTAACISGVFTFEDILVLSARRGKIMHQQARGSMLSVNLPEEDLRRNLISGVEISLINAPEYCVVSGTDKVISDFKEQIAKKYPGLQTVILKTSHAFHSYLMDPAVAPFKKFVEKTLRKDIQIPFISNTTGTQIKNEEAQLADYWSDHIRRAVNFERGIITLLEKQTIFLEVGPGSMLTSLLSQFGSDKGFKAIPVMRGAKQETDDVKHFLNAISQFWISGGEIKWAELYQEPRNRVSVPTYSFNRNRHWVDTKSYFSFDYDQDQDQDQDQDNDVPSEETYNIDNIDESISNTFDRSGFTEEYIKPGTEIQKLLVKTWEDYLGIKNIGIIDDFFSLGGHSLLASQVINKVNEHFKIDLPIEALFRSSTIEKLEKLVGNASKNTTLQLNLLKIDNRDYLPVSIEQKRLWTISQIDNNPAYNIPFTYRFNGELNEEIFTKSINAVFNRHSILRGRIATVDMKPFLVLDKQNQVKIRKIDYSDIPYEGKERRVAQFIEEDIRKLFDIENDPLYRLYLIRTEKDVVIFHLTVHHIIFDGWSWGVFVRDLKKAYNGLLTNQGNTLSNDVNQYYEYAQWQLSNISKQKFDKSIEYWKDKLKGHNGLLNFPYDFARKERRSGFGGKEFFKIDSTVQSELKSLAKKLNVTDFMIYISAFSIFLSKYSNDEDLCIGIPIANRPSYQLEEIIGFFVNTLIIRFQIKEKSTFEEYLNETKKVIIEAMEHQELPFEKLVDAIQPQRAVNINPIYQVAFAWLNTPSELFEFQHVKTERCSFRNGVAPLDLTFYFWEEKGCIEGEIEYSTDLLKHETILRLKNNFLNLINNLSESSNTRIESLSMITNEERLIIDGFNDTSTNYPKEKTIVELFEDLVNLYPNKTAVVFKENSLTYSQLNKKSNQLARVLRNSDVSANDPIGILADRSVDMIVGILGILKAGGAYVPLDPEYPEFRKNFIIRDSGCKILVTQNKYITDTADGIAKFSLDSSISYHNDKSNIKGINVSSDLAYIIYTSGTTGVPKGTLIPQQGVVRLVCNTNYVDFTSEDRVLQSTSIVFDASTVGIFGSLLNGATLYLIDKETLLDPVLLGDELAKNNITMTDFPTAVFTQIAEVRSDIFNKLKTLLIGGDALSAAHVNKVRKNNPHLTVINEYGPTENSCNSTCYKVDRDFDNNIPIGKPISNSTAYIFDKNMNYQPIGIIGELYVGGDGLSKGYLNREDLNRTCFIDHPNFPGKRLYKTGDLARWLPDGNIEFHGRIDNQLKIRGFRVELGEIESVISEIDDIVETVIKPIKIEEGDYKLVAFLNVPETFKMDLKEISSRVKEKLPSYMVPSAYKLMHGFPLTINGKIDRKALNFDTKELKNEGSDKTAPLTPSEKIIHKIWCDALMTKDISTTDNFFDIGGNSLLAINLVNLISKAFNITLKTFMIFEFPTIKDQSKFLEGKDSDSLSLKNIEIEEKNQRKKNVSFKKHRK